MVLFEIRVIIGDFSSEQLTLKYKTSKRANLQIN